MEPAQGYWLGNVVSGAYTLNSKKNPQVVLRILITDDAVDGAWRPLPAPFEEMIYMQMTGGAIPITEKSLDQLGFNGDFGNMQFATGERIQFESYLNEWQGNTTRKFRLPMEGVAAEPVSADVIREQNARWKMNHSQKPGGKPPAPPTARPAAKPASEPAPTGSNIPF